MKTDPGASPIVVEASFPVPPSKVFAAWTDPEQVKKWFGMKPGSIEEAAIDLTPGGRWRFVEAVDRHGMVGFQGSYLEISPDRRLVFSWTKFTEDTDGKRSVTPPSQVEITFDETAHGTNMRIVHSSVDPSSDGFAIGWDHGIEYLVAYLRQEG